MISSELKTILGGSQTTDGDEVHDVQSSSQIGCQHVVVYDGIVSNATSSGYNLSVKHGCHDKKYDNIHSYSAMPQGPGHEAIVAGWGYRYVVSLYLSDQHCRRMGDPNSKWY